LNNYIQSLLKCNYKLTGIILIILGAAYTIRAFMLVRPTIGLAMTNAYLLIIGIIFCISALGVYIFRPHSKLSKCENPPTNPLEHSPPVEGWRASDGVVPPVEERHASDGVVPPVEERHSIDEVVSVEERRASDSVVPPVEGHLFYQHRSLLTALICLITFTLTFETIGTIKSSFLFSFALGTMWNRKEATADKFSFTDYLSTNKLNIAVNILISCISAAGIWLVFEKIFRLSLP